MEVPKHWRNETNLLFLDGRWMRPLKQGNGDRELVCQYVNDDGKIKHELFAIGPGYTAQFFIDGTEAATT